MILRVQGEEFSDHISEEILLLTGRSRFLLDSFRHSPETSSVQFAIERLRLRRVRRWFPWILEFPEYEKSGKVITTVEVNDVEDVCVDNHFHASEKRFDILIGIELKKRTLSIYSAQEIAHGKSSYSLKIKLRTVDVILRDTL